MSDDETEVKIDNKSDDDSEVKIEVKTSSSKSDEQKYSKKSEKIEPEKPEREEKVLGIGDDYHNVEFINNEKIDEEVDKIVNEESDALIELEDKERGEKFKPPENKRSFRQKISNFFKAWWENRILRNSTFAALALLVVALVFIPATRYGMLNLAGVRVDASVEVVDSKSGLPLKNIAVQLQGNESVSGDDGIANFSDLRLGNHQVVINKIGFAPYQKDVTLGWGSNPLGPQPLIVTGAEFSFVLSDWLSGNFILEGEANSGENTAQSNDTGQIQLVVGDLNGETTATLSADGYRDEVVLLSDVDEDNYLVQMVPRKRHVFVSNRDGQYDLYKIDVDGKNEEVLMAASGKEREVPFVLPHQTQDTAAYITSRDGDVNKDNFILDGLYVIDINTGEERKVARSEQLQLVGWSGDKLIYVAVVEGVSAGNSQRSKIYSYDIRTGDKLELASANYFNDVKMINDKIYYAVSSFAVPESSAKLYTINPDGSDKNKLIDTQVWTIIRGEYETIWFNAINLQWFEQKSNDPAVKLAQAPARRQSRIYVTSPNGQRAIWNDVRDGKGALVRYDIEEMSDEVIHTASGVEAPVYWISDSYIIFRSSTNDETADYVMNLDGGEPQKITDVVGNRSRYIN